jgi:hypothetical protein
MSPIPIPLQLQYTSTDRRVYHYRTDTLTLSLSVDSAQQPTLQLQLKPARGEEDTHSPLSDISFPCLLSQRAAGLLKSCSC